MGKLLKGNNRQYEGLTDNQSITTINAKQKRSEIIWQFTCFANIEHKKFYNFFFFHFGYYTEFGILKCINTQITINIKKKKRIN